MKLFEGIFVSGANSIIGHARECFKLKRLNRCLIFALGIASGTCYADSVVGQIDTLYAAQGNNFGYRVYLSGGAPACSAANNGFAYTNVTDDNYKAYITTLTLAYSLGRAVTLVTEELNGFCHILEVYVRH